MTPFFNYCCIKSLRIASAEICAWVVSGWVASIWAAVAYQKKDFPEQGVPKGMRTRT